MKSADMILFNPRLPEYRQKQIREILHSQDRFPNHYWLMSSGTESARQGRQKMVGLSREAVLSAAEGVVKDFELKSSDIYLKSLPSFHIGGLSIYARAEVAGFKVIEARETLAWSPENFVARLESDKITVASLVPTQIFDVVQMQTRAPQNLRLIFVGGGGLSPAVYEEACALGWPLVLTYGMTETSAMVGWCRTLSEGLQKLSHVQDWRVEEEGRLSFLSPSLLSTYLFVSEDGKGEWLDPKVAGWYKSDDAGEIRNGRLFLKGRVSELVKIQGESVSLFELQNLWDVHQKQFPNNAPAVIVALPEPRRGFDLVLVTVGHIAAESLSTFNEKVLPFQRLARVAHVPSFPASELGKISRSVLADMLHQDHNKN